MDFRAELRQRLGLDTVEYRHNLSRPDLFRAALDNDRGRIRPDGPDDEPKAWATKTRRGPARWCSIPTPPVPADRWPTPSPWPGPRVEDKLWWKADLQRFNPDHFGPLLERVVAHLNRRQSTLFVQDVTCGWDPGLRRALPVRRRVRHPRTVRPEHVRQRRGRRDRCRQQALDHAQRAQLPLRPRPRRHPEPARRDHGHPQPHRPGAGPGGLLRHRPRRPCSR